MHLPVATTAAPPRALELRRRSLLATSLALAVLPPPARANFYERYPYVVPADVLPFVRDTTPPGDVGAVLAALDEFATHYPAYQLGAVKGRLLSRAVRDAQPRTCLELGSFLGYSALVTARDLQAGGRLLCIEASPAHAEVVRALVDYAGVSERVQVLVGLSENLLPKAAELLGTGGADFVFMDHAKECYLPDLLAAERLGILRRGSVLVADNVVYPGAPGFLPHVQAAGGRYETRLLPAPFEYAVSWREGLAEGKEDALSLTRYIA